MSAAVPLTTSQRLRLLLGCVPLILWVAAFAFIQTALDDLLGSRTFLVQTLVALFVLVFAFQAVNRPRDFAGGVALVREDLLERSFSSGGGR